MKKIKILQKAYQPDKNKFVAYVKGKPVKPGDVLDVDDVVAVVLIQKNHAVLIQAEELKEKPKVPLEKTKKKKSK